MLATSEDGNNGRLVTEGNTIRWTEYRIYMNKAVFTGVPRSEGMFACRIVVVGVKTKCYVLRDTIEDIFSQLRQIILEQNLCNVDDATVHSCLSIA